MYKLLKLLKLQDLGVFTQYYWIYGLYPPSRILNTRKNISETDLFPSSGDGRAIPTLFPVILSV
jgi:hypothetical protein